MKKKLSKFKVSYDKALIGLSVHPLVLLALGKQAFIEGVTVQELIRGMIESNSKIKKQLKELKSGL